MNQIPYYEIFIALTPQLMLVVGAFIALVLDLASLRRYPWQVRNRTIGTVAIVSLLAAAVPLCRQLLAAPALSYLGGTLIVSQMTAVFNLLIVILTIITIVISLETDIGRHVAEYFATILFGAIGMMLLVSTE